MPYLTGGISIAVLAVGSTAPGLLQFFINKCAQRLLSWDHAGHVDMSVHLFFEGLRKGSEGYAVVQVLQHLSRL